MQALDYRLSYGGCVMGDLDLRSLLCAWLGDRTSKADGDAHDHESLLAASRDLAALMEARVQAAADRRAASDAYIWINPARKSGEPCIGGHRLSVELVIESVWYGDVQTAMATYDLSRAQVLTACWYAGAGNVVRLHGKDGGYVAHRGPWRKRWGSWATEVRQALWQSDIVDYDDIPQPPSKPQQERQETDHE